MAGGFDSRPKDPTSQPGGPRPKTGLGFGNASLMNTQPPPHVQQPTRPPRNSQPNVPPQPPAPNPGALTTGPGGFMRPPLAPNPFFGLPPSQSTNLFGFPGPRPSEMDKTSQSTNPFGFPGPRPPEMDKTLEEILENSPGLPETPTKTDQKTLDEVYDLVKGAIDDERLLQQFRARVTAARGNKSVEQRKNELRSAIKPWIDAGLRYGGTRRPGLYLPDGTRNPERGPRGARPPPTTAGTGPGGPPPPPPAAAGTGLGGPQRPPAGTGRPPSRPGTNTKGTNVPPPAGGGNRSSTGGGTRSSTGPKLQPPGRRGPQAFGGSLKNQSSGGRKGSSKDTAKSPLSQPPLTTENVQPTTGPPTSTGPSVTGPPQGPPKQTGSRTAGAAWRRRDDLFEANVMDEAGITWSSGEEGVTALPTLESTIDYNTENWE